MITTRRDPAYSIALRSPEMHGTPAYFTTERNAARSPVLTLASPEQRLVVAGHGHPMAGGSMRVALTELAVRFDEVAVPWHGRYAPVRALGGAVIRS